VRGQLRWHSFVFIQLVYRTGRATKRDKRDAVDKSLEPILQRLNIDPDAWVESICSNGNVIGRAIGIDYAYWKDDSLSPSSTQAAGTNVAIRQ
jgi:hypothetical protein